MVENIFQWVEANQVLASILFCGVVLAPFLWCWRNKCRLEKEGK